MSTDIDVDNFISAIRQVEIVRSATIVWDNGKQKDLLVKKLQLQNKKSRYHQDEAEILVDKMTPLFDGFGRLKPEVQTLFSNYQGEKTGGPLTSNDLEKIEIVLECAKKKPDLLIIDSVAYFMKIISAA